MKNQIPFRQNRISSCRDGKPMRYNPLFLEEKQKSTLWDVASYELRNVMHKKEDYTLVHITDVHVPNARKVIPDIEKLRKLLESTSINFLEIKGLANRPSLVKVLSSFGFTEFPGTLIFSPKGELIFGEGNLEEVQGMPDAHFRYLLNTLHAQLPSEITKDLPGPLYLPTIRERLYDASPKELQEILDGTGNYGVVHFTSKEHCYWCKVAEPHVKKLEGILRDTDVDFLEIDIENLFEQRFFVKYFCKAFDVEGRPCVVLFSPEGEKIASHLGYPEPHEGNHYDNLVSFLEDNVPGF